MSEAGRERRLRAITGSAVRGPGVTPGIVIFSDRPVVAEGLVGLLAEDWRLGAIIAPSLPSLRSALGPGLTATILDASTASIAEAGRLTGEHGGLVLLLLSAPDQPVEPALLERADVVMLRDEVEPLTLRVALAAGRLGMRLLPRGLPGASPPSVVDEPPRLDETGQRTLALLAAGLRDAEIARELHLSESAVRKRIQRTVRQLGADTRCEAVAAAIRGGALE